MRKFTYIVLILGVISGCSRGNNNIPNSGTPNTDIREKSENQTHQDSLHLPLADECKILPDSDRLIMMDEISKSQVAAMTFENQLNHVDSITLTKVKDKLSSCDLATDSILKDSFCFVPNTGFLHIYTYLADEHGQESPSIILKAIGPTTSIPGTQKDPELNLYYVFIRNIPASPSINLEVYIGKKNLEESCKNSEFFQDESYSKKILTATLR